jgi:hypothetical protein
MCCVVLCCVLSCCVVLFCVVSCCVVSCCVMLCRVVSCRVMLCCFVSWCVVLCCVVLFCVVSCCVVLCYVVSCCVVLFCVVSCCVVSCRVVLFCVVLCRVLCRVVLCCFVLCRVVLCRVVSCRFELCYVVSCRVVLSTVVFCCVLLWRVVLCCVMLCRVVSCPVVLCYVVSCRVALCSVVSCRVVLCRVVSCRVVLCCVVLCCVVLCLLSKRLPVFFPKVSTIHFLINNQPDAPNSQIYFGMKLHMFRIVPLPIIRSYSLYTQQWYVIQVCRQLSSRIRIEYRDPAARKLSVWHIPLPSVRWITPDDGQRNCPKHVEFHFQNKFQKLVHLGGFIKRKRAIHVKNILGWSAVVFCACEKIQLFSVVFCVVGAEHTSYFGLVINGISDKCRLVFVTKRTCVLKRQKVMFLTGSVCLPPTVVANVKELPTLSKPNAFSWITDFIRVMHWSWHHDSRRLQAKTLGR